jgi:hypothetical protein
MATLYITEFANIGRDQGQGVQATSLPPVAEQTIAIGVASAQSGAFSGATNFIRAHADSICSIAVSVNPTAIASNARLAANQTEYFQVRPGDKIAVIQNS